ncbi:MAG: hypothetical protein JO071_00010 [Deltaproteobacteria bacterium]|nr:hypothetical protein [Deltaproteobacteria bacterium]
MNALEDFPHFASVRGIKYSASEGNTAELQIEQARKLFKSINTGHIIGLRDRAVHVNS